MRQRPQAEANNREVIMSFYKNVDLLFRKHEKLVSRPNEILPGNGVLNRCKYPVLTARHVPVFWRYDCCSNASDATRR